MDIETKLQLFHTIVIPVLLYGCEIWGFENLKDVEKIQVRFYKNILGLTKSSPKIAVFGELGAFPIKVLCKERIVKFWLKTLFKKDTVKYKIYHKMKMSIECMSEIVKIGQLM